MTGISVSTDKFDDFYSFLQEHQKRMISFLDEIEIEINDLEIDNDDEKDDFHHLLQKTGGLCDDVRDHLDDSPSAMIGKIHAIHDAIDQLVHALSSMPDDCGHQAPPPPSSVCSTPDPILPRPKIPIFLIPLKDIDTSGILEGFVQTKYNIIKKEQWFEKLQRDILPILEQLPDVDDNYFRYMDEKSGLAYPDGLLKIYQQFFGEHCIVLSKIPGTNRYSITNGIHRIFIAGEKGLKAIPARIEH